MLAKWVLIFYTVYTTPSGEESVTHHRRDVFYGTLKACNEAGNDQLGVIDLAPGYVPYFVCLPADAIDLGKRSNFSK